MTNGNQYHGNSTIGIESVGDTKAAFYDTYLPPQLGAQASTDLTGLLVSFTLDTLSSTKITITPTPTSGTIPFAVQYLASTLVVQNPNCPLDAVPGNIAYHWTFGDGGEAFSASGTHTYVLPNNYSVANLTLPMLRATDGSGAFITLPFAVIAADIPPVSMTVEPQGGAAPLQIKVTAVSTSPFAPILIQPGTLRTIDAFVTDASLPLTTAIQIDKLGSQNEPGQSTLFVVTKGGTQTTIPAPSETSAKATTIQDVISSTYLLDEPGSYRITGIFPATSFTFPTIGKGVVYVDVTDPNSSVSNSLIITQSNLYINWSGKTKNKLGVAPKPASDTISLSGYINLVGLDLSTLAGQQITLALNAFNPIFQGTLDANGNASQ